MLRETERMEQAHQRRWLNTKKSVRSQTADSLGASIKRVKRGIARLIDVYEDGLVERAEFAPRIKRAKDRLVKLEAEAKTEAERETNERELRLVIGRLQEFGERVKGGLDQADWMTRREIIGALERFPLMCSGVSASGEESVAVVGRDRVHGVAHSRDELTMRSGGSPTKMLFDFRPHGFDGVEVRRIGWQVANRGAGRLDCLLYPKRLVG